MRKFCKHKCYDKRKCLHDCCKLSTKGQKRDILDASDPVILMKNRIMKKRVINIDEEIIVTGWASLDEVVLGIILHHLK